MSGIEVIENNKIPVMKTTEKLPVNKKNTPKKSDTKNKNT